MKLLLLSSLFILVSCGSTMVQDGSNRSTYAPDSYQEKGIVKYLANGADFVIKARRDDAFKQMYMACNADYKITREFSENDGGNLYDNGFGGVGMSNNKYVVMEYECNKKEEARSAASVTESSVVNNGPFVPKPGQIVNNCKTRKDCGDGMSCKIYHMPTETLGMCGNHGLWGRMFYK